MCVVVDDIGAVVVVRDIVVVADCTGVCVHVAFVLLLLLVMLLLLYW